MDILKVIAVAGGLLLLYNGYNENVVPSPDPSPSPAPVIPDGPGVTVKIISDTNEPIPGAPGNASVAAASAPVRSILAADPNDAIKLARAFKGASELIGRNSSIKTTPEFQGAFQEFLEILFEKHGLSAKGYPLLAPIQATLVAAFSSVPGGVENGTVVAGPWTPAHAVAAQEALNALSYQAYQGFVDGHKKVQSFGSGGPEIDELGRIIPDKREY